MTEFFNGLKIGTQEFAKVISIIVNTVLLTFVYIFGIGITSIIAKVINKKFLKISLDEKSETYWEKLNLKKKPKNSYYKQF